MDNRDAKVGQRPTSDSDCLQSPSEAQHSACRWDGPDTLSEWLNEYGDLINRTCCLILGDRALAEDAAQETFIRAWKSMAQFKGDASPKTWLTRIAINVCRNMRRTAWFRHVDRRMEDLPEQAASFPFPDNTVITEVTKLPDKYREVILLRYYQDMKQKDIAAALGISDRAVRQRLNKANTMLREQLKEWYEDEG